MALPAAPSATPGVLDPGKREPMLEPGDRLSREEFEGRYERMPELKKAGEHAAFVGA